MSEDDKMRFIPALAAQLVREAREEVPEIKHWWVQSVADQLEAAMRLLADPSRSPAGEPIDVEKFRRIQAELRKHQEREGALIVERNSLQERLEKQAKWLAWPQYGEIGAAAALRHAVMEACDIGLSWSGSDTADGQRLRALKDHALRPNEDLAQEWAARKQERGVGPYKAGDP